MKAHIIYDDVKLKTCPMVLGDNTFNVSFTLNAIDEIQQKYGSLDDALEKMDESISVLKEMLHILIMDAIEREDYFPDIIDTCMITTRYIGSKIGTSNISYYNDCILQAMGQSLPDTEEEPVLDDEGNETVVTQEMLDAIADIPDVPDNDNQLKN